MTKQTRSSRKAAVVANVNLEAEIAMPTVAVADDAILGDLLEQLEAVEGDASITLPDVSDELIEAADAGDGAVDPTAGVALGADAGDAVVTDENLLEEIVGDAERQAQKQALYAEQEGETADGSAPETQPEAVEGKKKGKKASAPKEPKEPKAPRATLVNTKPGDLLKLKLGAKWSEFLVFSLNDATTLDTLALEAKAQEFIDKMNDKDAIADKVREKALMLFSWMQKGGGADALNEVMRRAFTVLHESGELTSGDKGNLQLNLLAKPYSIGTARSQANQMFMLFPLLGITVKEKGRMVQNPDSALLPVIKSMLGLA